MKQQRFVLGRFVRRILGVRAACAVIALMLPCVAAAQIELVRECRQRAFPSAVEAGNYSGIARLGGDEYAVVSDKSAVDGFFVFRISVDSITGELLDVRQEGFFGDSLRGGDCEAVAYCPSTSTLFISREADARIVEYDRSGRLTGRELAVPDVFKAGMGNCGFESLAYDGLTRRYWTVNESTLTADGDRATSQNGVANVLRLQSFGDDLQPREQYVYEMDKPRSRKKSAVYAMGVSEIAAVGDGRLLVLEREFFVPKKKIGAFVQCKLYEIMPDSVQALAPNGAITDDTPRVPKRLVCSFKTRLNLTNRKIADYEGMCFGPTLADGSGVIILVSDSQNQYAGVLKDWFKTVVVR